jgi:cytochrome P450
VLGVDLSDEGDERGEAVVHMQQYMSGRLVSRWPSVEKFPTPGNLRLHRARRVLHRCVKTLIAERRRNPGPPTDVLAMLVTARDPQTGKQLSDQQLLDNVMAFFMAGHETLAYPLTWAWYHLSRDPALRQQLHEEATRVLGGRAPTFQDLPHLRFASMVVQEAFRLYPSVWIFTRQAVQDDELGGFFIPARSIIVLCPFLTHRHAAFWPNPEKFDPTRFTPEQSANRPPFAYVPFAGGPHRCIGDELAKTGLTLMIAMIAQSYLPELINDAPIDPAVGVTVRPGAPVMMSLRTVDEHSFKLKDAPKEQRAPA